MDRMLQLARLKSIREILRTFRVINPRKFEMAYSYRQDEVCGTVGCIAGWTCITFMPEIPPEEVVKIFYAWSSWSHTAQKFLGINDQLEDWLFLLDELSLGDGTFTIHSHNADLILDEAGIDAGLEGLRRLDTYISLVEKYSEEELRSKGLICY